MRTLRLQMAHTAHDDDALNAIMKLLSVAPPGTTDAGAPKT